MEMTMKDFKEAKEWIKKLKEPLIQLYCDYLKETQNTNVDFEGFATFIYLERTIKKPQKHGKRKVSLPTRVSK